MAMAESLPDSVLLHVFKFLPAEELCLGARMACTRWWKVSHDAELWRSVELAEQFSNKRLHLLLTQIQDYIEELDCSKCEQLTEHGFLKLLALELPKLKRLYMPACPGRPHSGDKLFSALATVCPALEEVENIHPNVFDSVDPYKCQSLFKHLKVLHDRPVTTFGRVRNVAPKLDSEKRQQWRSGLTAVASFCTEVDAYNCCRGQGYVDDLGLKYVSHMFPTLRKLELRQCEVTDTGIEEFLKLNETEGGLDDISFDQPGDITDQALTVMAAHCPNLRYLKLSRCPGITSAGVCRLLAACPKLVEIHLNNTAGFNAKETSKRRDLDNTVLKALAASCPNLTTLRLLYSKAIDTDGINALVDGCRSLRALMLFECPGINDQALQAIQGFNFLKALVLVNCNVSPKGVVDLVLVAPSLVRLTLYTKTTAFLGDMSNLSEDTYLKLECDEGEFRPNVISRLTVKGVGGDYLQLLTVLCPNLHTLDLRDAVAVSIPAINTVLRNCEMLRVLDISSISLLDDTFLASLICYAEGLKRLSLGAAVRHLDIESLANVMCTHPALSMLAMDTNDTAVDEDNLLYRLKKSHNGKALLHIDPECQNDSRSFRCIEYHCTPLRLLGSVTQPISLYLPVVDFDQFAEQTVMPDLEGSSDEEEEVVKPRPSTSIGPAEASSEEDVRNAAAVSPQLQVWLGKKLKID